MDTKHGGLNLHAALVLGVPETVPIVFHVFTACGAMSNERNLTEIQRKRMQDPVK
jgi:hypothetical protein